MIMTGKKYDYHQLRIHYPPKCCMIHCPVREQMTGYLQVLKCYQPLMFHALEKSRR